MENPYRAPEAPLETGNPAYAPGVGWKIFFFFLLPIEIWSYYDQFTEEVPNNPLWWLCISAVIYTIYLTGLFGLAFAKKIGTSGFWIKFLPVMICADIYEFYDVFTTAELETPELISVLLVVVPLMMLIWWSVYKYSKVMDGFVKKL